MKFLVIQQKMIGDVLASTVICERIKSVYPDSIVHFVANHNTLAVLENNPFIDKVIVFEQKYRSNKSELLKFLKSIRKEVYHGVIDAYGKTESNLISLFAKSKFKVSHTKWYTKWIYSDTVQESLNTNEKAPLAIHNRLQLLNPILGETNELEYFPKIHLTDKEIEIAQLEVNNLKEFDNQKIIMIGILGSSALKTYPEKYMAEVLDYICTQTDARLLFNYIPNQKTEVLAVYQKCKKETQARIAIDFYAESLRGFLAILAQCTALIGNEGGAVNMAKALGIPTFCMFSPFIIKGAWHSKNSIQHVGIHLKDYKPELFEGLQKKDIKKNIETLYTSFEPKIFKTVLSNFIIKNTNFQKEVSE
ncbi:glycosyltransferase family 9 protein [Aurantibacter crassamenti]|uniref:glycosyltransferase family 9 protein n=1 Tax=Aurantibacter crassamenti TaxID=1837375 RepID=UPI00193A58B6|nr:glycosyltransferase family 9 protein [Aurantibacter crassamenti]MBM1106433.1 glycosyltransferase family 9 protein [Aurantibacter crassamenti]